MLRTFERPKNLNGKKSILKFDVISGSFLITSKIGDNYFDTYGMHQSLTDNKPSILDIYSSETEACKGHNRILKLFKFHTETPKDKILASKKLLENTYCSMSALLSIFGRHSTSANPINIELVDEETEMIWYILGGISEGCLYYNIKERKIEAISSFWEELFLTSADVLEAKNVH